MSREIKFRAWFVEDEDMQDCDKIDLPNKTHHKDVIAMQYTGLKDKNGKEIYEGDIVIFDNNPKFDSVVKWGDGGFKITLNKKKGYIFPLNATYAETCEIIGNIYENQELLEEK